MAGVSELEGGPPWCRNTAPLPAIQQSVPQASNDAKKLSVPDCRDHAKQASIPVRLLVFPKEHGPSRGGPCLIAGQCAAIGGPDDQPLLMPDDCNWGQWVKAPGSHALLNAV